MKDWRRKDIIRAVMTLQENNLMTYELASMLLEEYDERAAALDALQQTLDSEDQGEPVTLREAMANVVSTLPDSLADRINGKG